MATFYLLTLIKKGSNILGMSIKIKPLDSYEPELRESIQRLHRINQLSWNDYRDLEMSDREISNKMKLNEYTPSQPGTN